MRTKFPSFWIVQFLLMLAVGLVTLISPVRIVQFHRGQRAPQTVERPEKDYARWVIGLEQIEPPNERVRKFFKDHDEVTHTRRDVWTPTDPALKEYSSASSREVLGPSEDMNEVWEAVEEWFLSATPPPPEHISEQVREWIDSVDEIPVPSQELRDWVVASQSRQRPPDELKILILESRQALPTSWELAADQLRLSAPCILTSALFTLFGLISPSIRRPLARIFVLVFVFLTVALLLSSLGPAEWNLTHGILIAGVFFGMAIVGTAIRAVPRLSTGLVLWLVLSAWWIAIVWATLPYRPGVSSRMADYSMTITTGVFAVLGIINAYYWLIGKSEDPPQDDAGIAQKRPPQLWTLWVLQFILLMSIGLWTLIFPERMTEFFTVGDLDYLTTDVVDDSVRLLGGWIVAMGLFSFFSLGVGRDWIWQGIGLIFCVLFSVLALVACWNALSGHYSIWAFVYGFQGVVFIPFTLSLLFTKDPWSTENVEKDRPDWNLGTITVAPFLLVAPLLFGRRPLYSRGVAARGKLRVLPEVADGSHGESGIPANDFFRPNLETDVHIRFSNRTQEDDASLDIRGCAVCLSSEKGKHLELLFATGAFAPAGCLLEFWNMLPHRRLSARMLRHKVYREGLAAGMRRAPDSYAALDYYHQLVYEWLTPKGQHYLVRFRLKSAIGGNMHRGFPDSADLRHLWQQERLNNESRRPDYLRQELHERLAGGEPIRYWLEAQFHFPQVGDSLDWYDPSLEWDCRTHAWHALAEIVLDTPLDAQACAELSFDPSNLPHSLLVPKPGSTADLRDPRSLASAQFHLVRAAQTLRRRRQSKAESV